MLPGFATDFAYAARKDNGEVEACVFNLHGQGTSSHFSYLARNIETFFYTGASPYPGRLHSLRKRLRDPEFSSLFRCFRLCFRYAAAESCRELVLMPADVLFGGCLVVVFVDSVERTLLTTGIIDEVMQSRVDGGRRRLTPHLSTDTFQYDTCN